MRLLIVEDETKTATLLSTALAKEAHQGVIGYDVLPEGRTQVVITLPSPG